MKIPTIAERQRWYVSIVVEILIAAELLVLIFK